MIKLVNFTKVTVAGLALTGLVACSGLNFGSASLLQSIDLFNDDISQMNFAIDAPVSILPQDNGMLFKMDATTTELGERHVAEVLVRGDDILAFSSLKPPVYKRTYHLFSFSPESQGNIVEFQRWLRNVDENNQDTGGELTMNMELQFCRVANANVGDARVTVYISLPGKNELNPLFSNVKLSEIGGPEMGDLPVCVQT